MPLDFYSMATQLQIALKGYNYETILCNDRYPNSIYTKILWKLGLLTSLLSQKTRVHICSHFLQNSYDVCIIIKGVGVNVDLINEIHKKCPRIIGYNFDSFTFHPKPLEWYSKCDKYVTFDYDDAKRYGLSVVELYSASIENSLRANCKKIYDLFVLQKVHSDRLVYLQKVLDILQPQNPYIKLYESNWATAIRNFFHHPFLYIKFRKYIHFKPMPYAEYTDYMNKSVYTLDFAHPKQSGITMRCYEAAYCNTKIVTNNKNILKNKYFPNESVINIDIKKHYSENEKQIIKSLFMDTSYPEYSQNRNINDFVQDLLK